MYKISIITINYNNCEGLKRTVESVINQTWQEFEYIVIDGGSTDGSAAYLESQNDKIDYWISEADNGIYNAMNKGIMKATGEYLLFLNSGDHFYDLEILAKIHQYIKIDDLVYFDLNIIDGQKSYIKQYPEKLKFSYLYQDTLPHPATFIKKTLFIIVGNYDEQFKIVSDWDFFIKSICKYNCSYRRVNKILSTFYLDGVSSDAINNDLIKSEKESVLFSDFSAYIDDLEIMLNYKKKLTDLRSSRKIKLLIKLKQLRKF